MPLCVNSQTAESDTRRHNVILGLEVLGVNYNGFGPFENFSISSKLQFLQLNTERRFGITESINLGTTFGDPKIGFTCLDVAGLFGNGNNYFEIGCGGTFAFTEHYVHWRESSYGGGSVDIARGLQIVPHVGYLLLPSEKHFVFRVMLAYHYWVQTFELPAPMDDHVFWIPVGFSFAYKF